MKNVLDPLGDGVSSVELVQHLGNDKTIVRAARVSFSAEDDGPFSEGDGKLLKYLADHRHGTPFEHNLMTFRVKAPLYIIVHFLKHRVGVSINQESHRYIEPGKRDIEPLRKYYLPARFRKQSKSNKQGSEGNLDPDSEIMASMKYQRACEKAFDAYEELLSLGVCREQARGVLVTSTYASFWFTCNVRSLLHYLSLRAGEGAQKEDTAYANAIETLAMRIFPETFKYARPGGVT